MSLEAIDAEIKAVRYETSRNSVKQEELRERIVREESAFAIAFAWDFVESESFQQRAFQCGGILPHAQAQMSVTHGNEKTRQLDSLAKLLVYKTPFVALTQMRDETCTLCLSGLSSNGDLESQRGKLTALSSGTLKYIQETPVAEISRRRILLETVQNGNESAAAFISSFRSHGDSDVRDAVERIASNPTVCSSNDIARVFESGERANRVFFDAADINNTKQLLDEKNLSDFVRITDTVHLDKMAVHVELNAVGVVLEQNEQSVIPQMEINIGLANQSGKSVGSCAGCVVVQDVLAETRGIRINRSGDYAENYPQQGYPLPKYLTLEERVAVVVKTDELFQRRRGPFFGRGAKQEENQRLFEDLRDQHHRLSENMRHSYIDVLQLKAESQQCLQEEDRLTQKEEALRLKRESLIREGPAREAIPGRRSIREALEDSSREPSQHDPAQANASYQAQGGPVPTYGHATTRRTF